MSVELPLSDQAELLRKAILQLPIKYNFEFNDAAKVDLRRLLNFSASHGGKYLKYLLFPYKKVTNSSLPESWAHVLIPERYPNLDNPRVYSQRAKNPDICHPNRTCGLKFVKGEPIYRCATCGKDDSSGICVHCFDEEKHKGHEYSVFICSRESGGICDCGNTEVWTSNFPCSLKDVEENPESEIPDALKESLLQTMEIALDYLVDVLSHSHTRLNPVNETQDILRDAFNSALDNGTYFGEDWASPESYLMLFNDETKQYRDATERITLATEKLPEFSQMIADEVSKNGRAKVFKSSDLDELIEKKNVLEATGLPCTIRNAREVFREDMCQDILDWLTELSNGEILGNYNISRDALTRAFCKRWNAGVKPVAREDSNYDCALIQNRIPNIRKHKKYQGMETRDHWKTQPQIWDLDETVAAECDYPLNFAFFDQYESEFTGSRFQYLLYLDLRFWKSIRRSIHNLFNCILPQNQRYKGVVCAQYMDIYPTILELFYHHGTDPDYSCMASLTAQIFSSTSNADMIVKHGDVSKLLATAYGFITLDRAVRPMELPVINRMKLFGFKNKRLAQLFYDLCFILNKTSQYDTITTFDFFNQICDLLVLFQGRPVLKREAHEHVEYENNDFNMYFTIYTILTSVSELAAKCLKHVDLERSNTLIQLVVSRLFRFSHTHYHDNTVSKPVNDVQKMISNTLETIDGRTKVIDFKVQESYVSLLHPLHAFLSWCLQYANVDASAIAPPQPPLPEASPEEQSDFDPFDLKTCVMEYPLRSMVLLSQIRCGLWVRNGQSLKSQMIIYMNTILRETSFKRDLQLIQTAASIYGPKFVFSSFISRWCLLPWLKENFGYYEDYPQDILSGMVSEFILFLIHLLSETEYLTESRNLNELRLKKALIHVLCFGPMSYSKIHSSIPEFLLNEKRYKQILEEITDYTEKENNASIYTLKEKYFDEIDPYYIFYSTNRSEEAESILKERTAKKLKLKKEDGFIIPITKTIDSPIFKDLFKISSLKLFSQFLRSTLKFIDREGLLKCETMLNRLLHLIHISIEGSELSYSLAFCENVWSELTADHNEPFYYESVGSLLYKLLTNEDFSGHHSKIRAVFLSLRMKNSCYDIYLSEQVQNYDPSLLNEDQLKLNLGKNEESEFDKKKRKAQERKSKIMAKFRKQQAKFNEKNRETSEEPCDQIPNDDNEMDVDDEEEGWKYPEECCILCQMPEDAVDSVFGVVGYVSKNFVARSTPFESKYWTTKAFHTSQMDSEASINRENEDNIDSYFNRAEEVNVIGPVFPNASLTSMHPTFASCGHGLHYSCFQEFILSNKTKQIQITRTVAEEFDVTEYICPLCKCLGNVFMPVLWDSNKNRLIDFIDNNWQHDLEHLERLYFFNGEFVKETLTDLALHVRSTLLPKFRDPVFDYTPPQALTEVLNDIYSIISEHSKPKVRNEIPSLVAGTITSLEVTLREMSHESGLVFNLLNNHSLTALRVLCEFKDTWTSFQTVQETNPGNDRKQEISAIEEGIGRVSLLMSSDIFNSIEEIDFFEYVVSCAKLPNITMNTIYRLAYIYTFIQTAAALLTNITDFFFEKFPALHRANMISAKIPSTYRSLNNLMKALRDSHPLFDNLPDEICDNEAFSRLFFTLLCRSITPFLRKLAIWAVAINSDFSTCNVQSYSITEGSESTRLAQFLNLPSIEEMIALFSRSQTFEAHKFREFVKYANTTDNELKFKKLPFPGKYELLHLPTRLDDISTRFVHQNLGLSQEEMRDPALCLLCGTVVKLQKKAVSGNLGECNAHVKNECIHNVGIFLIPQENTLLLLNRGIGSFHSTPYIDKHGEMDNQGKKGEAVELSKKKYEQFMRSIWLMNELPHYITRKIDGALDIGGWESL